MEPDRYEQSHAYFITGILCLILSMAFFGLCLYLLPNLLFNLHYAIPEVIVDFYGYVLSNYQVGEKEALWYVFLAIFGLGLISSVIAYIASNHIENKIHKLEEEKNIAWSARKQSVRDSGRVFFRILLVVGFVLLLILLFQWVIASPPTPDY